MTTTTTPGSSLARDVSIELIFACANGLRRIAMCSMFGQLDVLDVVAPPDDEARVLLALDAAPQPALVLGLDRGHDGSFIFFAAHCTDLTMFW